MTPPPNKYTRSMHYNLSTKTNRDNTATRTTMATIGKSGDGDLPPPQGERHVLKQEEELRLEVPHSSSSSLSLTLQKGSCELYGVELAMQKTYVLLGGSKLALFTWHGCVIDVECDNLEISYTSDETNANVAFVNTHAQIEALRDEALQEQKEGPRVLIVGPPESGKSTLARVLTAYATKMGRTPLWADLDPADNSLSVPGTLSVAPITSLTVEPGLPSGTATPLVMWYGSTSLSENPELFRAQVQAVSQKMDQRLQGDSDSARASGIIVNTNGWIQDDGYQLLLHTINVMRISVVLIMGHDRLYSMLKSQFAENDLKIIKLPRSGGVVSRDSNFLRQSRSMGMKRYFYGDMVPGPNNTRVPCLTPFLAHVPFADVTIYKLSSVALSASLLPVSAKQSTEPVQLSKVELTEKLQHSLLAVCHPTSVHAYKESGMARDLYAAGVAGFVAVERVLMDAEMLHLLSPCAGSLPSHTLLIGDITWTE